LFLALNKCLFSPALKDLKKNSSLKAFKFRSYRASFLPALKARKKNLFKDFLFAAFIGLYFLLL
jgi:hypothetical protein